MTPVEFSPMTHAKMVLDFDTHFRSLTTPLAMFVGNDAYENEGVRSLITSGTNVGFDENFDLRIAQLWFRMTREQKTHCVLRVIGSCFHYHFGKFNALDTVVDHLAEENGIEIITQLAGNQRHFVEYWCDFMLELGEDAIGDGVYRSMDQIREWLRRENNGSGL